MNSVQIVGPSIDDSLSSVRGTGRYVQALTQVLDTDRLADIVIDPFFNIVGYPWFGIINVKSKHKIAVIHDVIPLLYPLYFPVGIKGKLWITINRMLLQSYDRIVTDSHTSKLDIMRLLGIPSDKISVVYPYSALQTVTPFSDISHLPYDLKEKQYLLYVGDINWHKNIVNIANAAIATNTRLVCVGMAFTKPVDNHSWLSPLREFLVIAAQYPDLILKTGFVNDQTLATLYSHALANVLISHNEGFGYSYIEAGYCQTPSILANRPIFHEISADKGAVFVDPEDSKAIGRQYLAMKDNPSIRARLGNEAYVQSNTTYSQDNFRRQWRAILNSI